MVEVVTGASPRDAQARGPGMARNILSNWGGLVFSLVVNFFLAPFVVHKLGNAAYGAWVLMVSLTGYLGLLDLGVRGAVTRYVAKFHTKSDHKEASQVASSALGMFTAGGILAIAVSLVLAFFVVHSFQIPKAYQGAARIVLVLGGVSVAVSLMSGVFGGILVGLHRFDLMNGLEVVSTGLRALATVVALHRGNGLIVLICIQLAFTLLRGLANLWICFRLYPQLQVRFSYCDRQHIALILSYSIYSFLLQVFDYVIYYADTVVIGALLPVDLITFFAIGGNLVTYARSPIRGISQTMTPLASTLEAQNNQGELQRVALASFSFATLVTFPIALTFMLRGKSFIGLWMGPEYAELSGQVLRILAVPLLFSAGNQVAAAIMFGISKHRVLVPVTVAEALCNLVLSVALVAPLGIIGVALGTALPNLVVNLVFWPWYLRRAVGIPLRRYFVSMWVRPALAMALFTTCSYAVEISWPAKNLAFFFIQVGALLPLAVVGAWFLCFTPPERRAYSQRFLQPLLRALGRT